MKEVRIFFFFGRGGHERVDLGEKKKRKFFVNRGRNAGRENYKFESIRNRKK